MKRKEVGDLVVNQIDLNAKRDSSSEGITHLNSYLAPSWCSLRNRILIREMNFIQTGLEHCRRLPLLLGTIYLPVRLDVVYFLCQIDLSYRRRRSLFTLISMVVKGNS